MTDPRCEVRLLGQLSVVFSDGRETLTRFRTRKASLLLALLALRPGQSVARETLVEYLWPDLDEAAARDNLSTALSQLRRQLGATVFQADHASVRLDPALVTTDIQRFERLVRQRTHASLTEALAFWGDPLPGVYDDWAADEQNRLSALAEEARDLLEHLPAPKVMTPLASATVLVASVAAPIPDNPAELLPPLRGGTVGRDVLLGTLENELSNHRLWTLLGPGGVGKTHLSLTLARRLAGQFARAVFVPLAEIPAPAFLLPAMRRALRLPPPSPQGPEPLEEVIEALNIGPTLLVLDNLEHLLVSQELEKERGGGIEGLVECLRDRCPDLTIVTTSRQALGLHGERVWPVPPLTPQDALQLFVLRARDVRPDFALHTGNRAPLEKLCGLLEGLPLAVELAAGWARLLSPERLTEKVEAEAHLLEGRRRDAPERQQSLTGALTWSWRLLAPTQQATLRRLSVIPGEFSLELAEELLAHPNALERLAELEERSLLTPTVNGGWRLLEPLRAFLADRLEEAGETETTHIALTDALITRMGDSDKFTPDAAWLDAREEELGAIRAAMLWCIEHDPRRGQKLAQHAWQVWEIRGYMAELRRFVRQLDTGDDAPASFLDWTCVIQLRSGNYEEAERLAERGCKAARREGNLKVELCLLQHLQTIARHRGDLAQAQALNPPIMALAEQLNDPHTRCHVHNTCGLLALTAEDYPTAKQIFIESVAMANKIASKDGEAVALNNLGLVSVITGDINLARESYTRSLAILEKLGYPRLVRAARGGMGGVALAEGDLDRAEQSFREALALSSNLGLGICIAEDLYGLAKVRIARENWDDATRVLSIVYRMLEELRVTPPGMVADTQKTVREHTEPTHFEHLWQTARLQSDGEVLAAFPADTE
ncbi:MAG: winged helix-turn-helix domain-containing protein [Armatimonas sp.]